MNRNMARPKVSTSFDVGLRPGRLVEFLPGT